MVPTLTVTLKLWLRLHMSCNTCTGNLRHLRCLAVPTKTMQNARVPCVGAVQRLARKSGVHTSLYTQIPVACACGAGLARAICGIVSVSLCWTKMNKTLAYRAWERCKDWPTKKMSTLTFTLKSWWRLRVCCSTYTGNLRHLRSLADDQPCAWGGGATSCQQKMLSKLTVTLKLRLRFHLSRNTCTEQLVSGIFAVLHG